MHPTSSNAVTAGDQMTEHFQIPGEAHIGRVHLQVSNLEKSLQMYGGMLGFVQMSVGKNTATLSSSTVAPPLILLTENRDSRPKPPRTTGLYHMAVRFPSRVALARVLVRLLEHRIPLQGFADHRVSEAIYLSDHDGNGLELYADRPRAEWTWVRGQIEMATDPLDVDNLLAMAKNDPSAWKGIDQATDIGHIHLQVGDLDRSERFYHDVIGFDVMQRSYPGALFLAAGGYHHHIGLNIWAGRNAQPPPKESVGLLAFTVVVPNQESLSQLGKRLASVGIPHKNGKEGTLIVHDPDGIVVDFAATN